MLGLKVPIKEGEKIRKKLNILGILVKNKRVFKENGKIIFPVLEKPNLNYQVVEREFDDCSKQKSYKDIVNIPENMKLNLPSSYDIVGDIIVISDMEKSLLEYEKDIANSLLKVHKNVKVVCKKKEHFSGEFRTQKLQVIAGKKRTETIHKENNAFFKIDLDKVYFSPRLSRERKRIIDMVLKEEIILVMFSGCGIYPIVISKNTHAKTIYSVEKNPLAHDYALINKAINKSTNTIFFKGDVREIVPNIKETFDRIIMPLPKSADVFLEQILPVLKERTYLHLYTFSHEKNYDEIKIKINDFANDKSLKYEILQITKCGQYSPCLNRVCVDFVINKN